jgi:F-type H+-transporting ATPase subunit a
MSISHALDGLGISAVITDSILVVGLLLLTAVLVRRRLAAAGGGLVPDEGVSLRNVVEFVVEGLASVARSTMGEDWKRFFPLVGAIFFFIVVANLISLLPMVEGATSNINTTAAWATLSLLVSEYAGLRKHGAHYIKHFMGPLPALAPLFLILELPLHLARGLTLAIRLLANMFADHTIVAVWLSLVPLVVPAIFMGLGVIVSILQAFVFAMLTMVYIGLNLEDAH